MSTTLLRKATIGDVADMHRLINHYAEKRLLLARSLSELYERLRDFFVLVTRPEEQVDGSSPGGCQHELIGVCGLGICWEDLAEIRSLAVWESYRGRGFGSVLVNRCLEEAKELGISRVFTLTYAPYFFEKLGFRRVDKSTLPQKVWGDCLRCPQFPNCDELALVLDLKGVKPVEHQGDIKGDKRCSV
jgi:amino-acid N-acetyltransferase